MPAPWSAAQARFLLGWYQHIEGRVPWSSAKAFFGHMDRFAAPGTAP